MPAQSAVPQPDPGDPARPSRRERRRKRAAAPRIPGADPHNRGSQNIPPVRKYNNYRRG